MSSKVFYRNLHGSYESVVSADGMYLRTAAGQRILDAVGGAGTVVLGHAVREITDAIARHGSEISFSYGATFTNPWQEELAEALVAMNPRIASRVYFVSGGSEGVETAVKMARQYHLQCGRPGRHKVIARWQSFHGSTLATLGLSGRPAWREPYLPLLPPPAHRAAVLLPLPAREDATRRAVWPAPTTWSGRSCWKVLTASPRSSPSRSSAQP